MSILRTQGTDLFLIKSDDTVIDAGCISEISGISSPRDQIEVTCLNGDSREYVAGMKTPGSGTFNLYLDTQNTAHTDILALYQSGETVTFAIGTSEATGVAPTVTDGVVDYPTSRSFIAFDGYLTDFPFSFEQNSVVQVEVGYQITGEISLLVRTV